MILWRNRRSTVEKLALLPVANHVRYTHQTAAATAGEGVCACIYTSWLTPAPCLLQLNQLPELMGHDHLQ